MPSLIRKATQIFSGRNSGVSESPNDTSGGTVPVASSPLDGIPTNILAFRTITTLLAKIQHEKPLGYSDLDKRKLDSSETNELRISTAFAIVANTDIDVIAIASTLSMDKVEVIACTNRDNDELIDRSVPSKISDIWNLLFSSNPRRDDDNGHTGEDQIPRIASIVAPPGVSLNDPDTKTLESYIVNEWCVDCLPSQPTFTSYLIAIKGRHL
jgi:hypothetical protein